MNFETQRKQKHRFDEQNQSYQQMADRHKKSSSPSQIIREMSSKSTMRCHTRLVRMAIIKENRLTSWRGVEKRKPSDTVGWEYRPVQPHGGFSKKLTTSHHMAQHSPLPEYIYPKGATALVEEVREPKVHSSIFKNWQDTEAT